MNESPTTAEAAPSPSSGSRTWDVEARGRPLLIFDGDCGFCTRSVEWVRDRLREPLAIAPWQFIEHRGPGVGAVGLEVADFERYAWWIGPSERSQGGRTERGHRAIARALLACRRPWPLVGRLLLTPPLSWLAAIGYRIVSRHRHRMPGGTPACRL